MVKLLRKNLQMQPNSTDPASVNIEVSNISSISPHNRALYEAGKTLFVESTSTGREFCKFMIGNSTAAIPTYLALLKFVLPEKFSPTFPQGFFALCPSVLFLLSSIIFTIGYFPIESILSLDMPHEIRRERVRTIRRRRRISIVGFSIFCLSTFLGISVVMTALYLDPAPLIHNYLID